MLKSLKIRPSLIWDVDKNLITEENNSTLIIERVINFGNLAEWNEIVRFYGIETIKEEVIKAGDLYPKSISFIENYLNIPKTKLRCFIRKQLNQSHWTL